MKRLLGAAVAALLLLFAVLLLRAATFESRQPEAVPAEEVAVDVEGAAARLAAGLRFQTVSHQEEALFPEAEFGRFRRHLERSFPLVHEQLAREEVAGHSLLYTWQGRDAMLRPGLLLAHQDVVPSMEMPVAVVGIAEKGYVSIGLAVETPGGHSSTPPPHTAVGILSTAIHRLEANPMPASLGGTTRTFLAYLGPELPFHFRVAIANLWLFGGLVRIGFERSPATNAMIRTTTAATIFDGGVKENVLPSSARAVVNFRILPGETWEDVAEHVRRVVDDERVTLEAGLRTDPRDPSPVSPVDAESFTLLQRTIREVFPDVPVAPYLVVGGTDARHYGIVSENVYRFSPFLLERDDVKLPHGTNERLSLENIERGVRFYRRWVTNSCGGLGD